MGVGVAVGGEGECLFVGVVGLLFVGERERGFRYSVYCCVCRRLVERPGLSKE